MKKLVYIFALITMCNLAAFTQATEKHYYGLFTTDNPMPYCDLISSRPVNLLGYRSGTSVSHKLVAEFIKERKAKLMANAYTKGNAVVGYRVAIGVTQNGVTVSMDGVAVHYDCTKHDQKINNKG